MNLSTNAEQKDVLSVGQAVRFKIDSGAFVDQVGVIVSVSPHHAWHYLVYAPTVKWEYKITRWPGDHLTPISHKELDKNGYYKKHLL